MRKLFLPIAIVAALILPFAFGQPSASASPSGNSCWGQATKVFVMLFDMGEHASQQETPRLGLRNLARALHEADVIDDDSMQALGAFVAAELGLEVEACEG